MGNDRKMQKKIMEDRAEKEAEFMIETNATMRDTAKVFGCCKSTVCRDMNMILPEVNLTLYDKVQPIISDHIETRASRGGAAFAEKRRRNKEICNYECGCYGDTY